MESSHEHGSQDLFQAQTHLYNHIFNFIDSMSLKCALELGIPDIIHNHNQPITLPELVSKLHINPSKTASLYRLMRVLVHSNIFSQSLVSSKTNEKNPTEIAYSLTPTSSLLIKSNTTCLSPFVKAMLDPALVTPWHFLGKWFKEENEIVLSPFEAAHGVDLWGYEVRDTGFNDTFNCAMASDSRMINLVVMDCKEVFDGLGSLVDVGGGTGTASRIICEAFPEIKCTVLDLPHVVADLPDCEKLNFVGGDMFQSIPPGDAVLLKLMLHAWSDEDCVKVLQKCREAIAGRNGGKVIIIDIVIGNDEMEEKSSAGTKLFFDMLMMTVATGRERTEQEWKQMFLQAGFRHYKIRPLFGLRSLIEVVP